jgi:DNA invertase Pin-like site-specific DNA recombinase
MKLGYARVSTIEQNLSLQIDALEREGCNKIFREKVSGSGVEKRELQKLLAKLRKGDTLVVWKLDRIGRTVQELDEVKRILQDRGVELKALRDPIDLGSASGRFLFNILASVCELEKDIIMERSSAGMAVAKANGIKSGRKPGLSEDSLLKAALVVQLYNESKLSIKQICRKVKISKKTLYNYLKIHGIVPNRGFSGQSYTA